MKRKWKWKTKIRERERERVKDIKREKPAEKYQKSVIWLDFGIPPDLRIERRKSLKFKYFRKKSYRINFTPELFTWIIRFRFYIYTKY